jgi:metal transporter CNNM
VIDHHHWMLVTLLLSNAAALETLPIFLDNLVSPFASVLISVTLVLAFGEIIPQALCTGPRQI